MAQNPSEARFPDDEMALTPQYKWDHETRCFFRDPDGHLFEIGQV